MSAALRWSVFALFLMFPLMGWTASTEEKLPLPDDIMATGGAGVASYDRFGMIFMNPASLANPDYGKLVLLQTALSIQPALPDFLKSIYSPGTSSTNPAAVSSLAGKQTGFDLDGPLMLGYVGKSIGVLLYSQEESVIGVGSGPGAPVMDLGAIIDFGIIGGYAGEIPAEFGPFRKLDAGFDFRYIYRVKYSNDGADVAEVANIMNHLFSPQDISFLVGQAIGSDLGLLWRGDNLAAGVSFKDWFSTTFSWVGSRIGTVVTNGATNVTLVTNGSMPADTYYAPSLDVGLSYRIPSLFSKFVCSDLTFYADLINVLDWSETPLMKIRLGVETLSMGFLRLRAGLYDGYPTAGVGLDFPFVKLSASMYTEELGSYIGAKPYTRVGVSLQFIL